MWYESAQTAEMRFNSLLVLSHVGCDAQRHQKLTKSFSQSLPDILFHLILHFSTIYTLKAEYKSCIHSSSAVHNSLGLEKKCASLVISLHQPLSAARILPTENYVFVEANMYPLYSDRRIPRFAIVPVAVCEFNCSMKSERSEMKTSSKRDTIILYDSLDTSLATLLV